MKSFKLIVSSSDDMTTLGYLLTKYMKPNLVITLNGDLGAGKTTFTKGIGKALGVERVINSPTFTIMKIHDATNKINGIDKLYHLDVYRLTSSESDFELEEYFYLNGVTVIEWANIINDLIPHDRWDITINDIGDNKRIVSIIDYLDLISIEEIKEASYEIID